ncbi:MAG: aminotransferase class V-fold PLP-dependent enzyme [Candidatus Hermodarchaeota archaeon]
MVVDAISLLRQSPSIIEWTFLNHAASSPPLTPSVSAIHKYLEHRRKQESVHEEVIDTRRLFAELLGVSTDTIAFSPNVASALSIVWGLDYPIGSNVVTYANDFPSNVYTCFNLERIKKVEVRCVPDMEGVISPEVLAGYVDSKTRLIIISHVQWISGYRIDLKEICKIANEVDAILAVDIMQSVGMLNLDFKEYPVDIAAGGVAKWLLGPTQVGFLHIHEDRLKDILPVAVGHCGAPYEGSPSSPSWDVTKLNLWSDARKYQVGSVADMIYYATRPCMKLMLDYGMDKVEKRILKLRNYLIEQVIELGSKFGLNTPIDVGPSGIVNVKVPNDSLAVEKLKEKKIAVSARGGGIRVSPHFYNTEEEIDYFIKALKEIFH